MDGHIFYFLTDLCAGANAASPYRQADYLLVESWHIAMKSCGGWSWVFSPSSSSKWVMQRSLAAGLPSSTPDTKIQQQAHFQRNPCWRETVYVFSIPLGLVYLSVGRYWWPPPSLSRGFIWTCFTHCCGTARDEVTSAPPPPPPTSSVGRCVPPPPNTSTHTHKPTTHNRHTPPSLAHHSPPLQPGRGTWWWISLYQWMPSLPLSTVACMVGERLNTLRLFFKATPEAPSKFLSSPSLHVYDLHLDDMLYNRLSVIFSWPDEVKLQWLWNHHALE